MARPPKGKPLTLRPIRLDDDVWAECQRLGKEHGTINEGLRVRLLNYITDKELEETRVNQVALRDRPFLPETPDAPVVTRQVSRAPKLFKGPIPKPKDKK